MKGFGFSTIILGFVLVTLIVSVGLIAFTMYKMSSAPDYVLDSSSKTVTTEGISAKVFWDANKLMLLIPTVSNILSIILLGVLTVTS